MSEQTIPVPLRPGSRVTVFDNVDVDPGGFVGSLAFEGVVESYCPDTLKLSFEDSDVGYAEFTRLLDENDSVQIITE